MWRWALPFLLGAALAAGATWLLVSRSAGQSEGPPETSLTMDLRWRLERAPAFEYLTLAPEIGVEESDREQFHGWVILARRALGRESEHRKQLIDALDESVRTQPRTLSLCFAPRHAIRIEMVGGELMDLVICFECNDMRVFMSDAETPVFTRGGMPMPAGHSGAAPFNEVASTLGMTMSEPASSATDR